MSAPPSHWQPRASAAPHTSSATAVAAISAPGRYPYTIPRTDRPRAPLTLSNALDNLRDGVGQTSQSLRVFQRSNQTPTPYVQHSVSPAAILRPPLPSHAPSLRADPRAESQHSLAAETASNSNSTLRTRRRELRSQRAAIRAELREVKAALRVDRAAGTPAHSTHSLPLQGHIAGPTFSAINTPSTRTQHSVRSAAPSLAPTAYTAPSTTASSPTVWRYDSDESSDESSRDTDTDDSESPSVTPDEGFDLDDRSAYDESSMQDDGITGPYDEDYTYDDDVEDAGAYAYGYSDESDA